MVDKPKGVEWNAVLGEEGEESIGRVIKQGSGEEAPSSGDQCRGRSLGALAGNEAVEEDTGSWDIDASSGVGVDVDVE